MTLSRPRAIRDRVRATPRKRRREHEWCYRHRGTTMSRTYRRHVIAASPACPISYGRSINHATECSIYYIDERLLNEGTNLGGPLISYSGQVSCSQEVHLVAATILPSSDSVGGREKSGTNVLPPGIYILVFIRGERVRRGGVSRVFWNSDACF